MEDMKAGMDITSKQPQDLTLTQLPEEDQDTVRQIAGQIDMTNAAEVLQYGATAQQKLTVFADTALQNARAKDAGVAGETLANLVGQLQGFGDTGEKRSILGFFKRGAGEVATLKARYDKVSVSVDGVAAKLEDHRVNLLRDIATLDRLYDENVDYYKQLCFYIIAGKEKMDKVQNEDLPQLREKATQSGDPSEAQAASDMAAALDRFEKKVHDLELTRQISVQMAPQIRLLQNNDSLMADKIHSALVNTLPLWKSQMVLALGLEHSREAIAAQKAVTDATNRMLRENAEVLKQGTIETARASERGIVDIETLTATNQALIDSLTEVETIQREGRAQRAAAETKLRDMEEQLRRKLLEVRDNQYTSKLPAE
ncbi:MAG: toxic anion resistance protein [Clostridia bacterium]|nr:toxic anion resistance protein [Clostridia bacterium]